jgi:tellurite resistance protein
MFDKIFSGGGPHQESAQVQTQSLDAAVAAGETATVRRIVARLEQLPTDQARLVAAAGYTLARAAQADLDISDEETAVIEQELQGPGIIDEPTAVLVTEMAKLQALTVGGTEDYVVTRELAALATDEQKVRVLRACFAVGAANGTISAEESAVINQIGKELGLDAATVNKVREEFHDRLSSVQAIRKITPAT